MTLDPHAIAVMGLAVLAFALFASERLSIEATSFGVLVALTAGFVVFPYPAVAATDFFFLSPFFDQPLRGLGSPSNPASSIYHISTPGSF